LFGHPVVDQTIHKHALDWLALVVYLCTFALVAYATRRRPSLGVAALILVDPFALYRDVADTTLTLPKIVLVAVWAGLALRRDALDAAIGLLRDQRARPLLVCATLVVFATALSVGHADFRAPALRETLKAIEYLLLFVTVIVALRLDPNEGVLRVTIAVALGLVTIAALSQEVLGAPSGFWFFNHPIPRIAGPLEGPNQLSGYLGLGLPVVAAFVMTQWDVVMDPPEATISKAWIWHDGGAHFGVPLSNYLGWLLTSWLFYQAFAIYLGRRHNQSARTVEQCRVLRLVAILLYVCSGLTHLVPWIMGQSGEVTDAANHVWRVADLRETAVVVLLFTMLFTSMLAGLRLATEPVEVR